MQIHVSLQITGLNTGIFTLIAHKWLCVTVYENVRIQLIDSAAGVSANLAAEWFLAAVYHHVPFLLARTDE